MTDLYSQLCALIGEPPTELIGYLYYLFIFICFYYLLSLLMSCVRSLLHLR